ncbi:hypothetical protein WN51_11106 [Melipona quadrifasciata]|uniref:Uncharacterized protein n=1 Tax=Melipona quadrifasciata TaxID=166423 RepID=A0A0M9A6C0_9HYME|nr:hypothetical protein WN51_11106 [Melipona quadrifasciata]
MITNCPTLFHLHKPHSSEPLNSTSTKRHISDRVVSQQIIKPIIQQTDPPSPSYTVLTARNP